MRSYIINKAYTFKTPLYICTRCLRGRLRIKETLPAIARKSESLDQASNDFFGIERGEGLISVCQDEINRIAPQEKYDPIINSKLFSDEKLFKMKWGNVRLDINNKAKIHGHFEVNKPVNWKKEFKSINAFVDELDILESCHITSSNYDENVLDTKRAVSQNSNNSHSRNAANNISQICSEEHDYVTNPKNHEQSPLYKDETECKVDGSQIKTFSDNVQIHNKYVNTIKASNYISKNKTFNNFTEEKLDKKISHDINNQSQDFQPQYNDQGMPLGKHQPAFLNVDSLNGNTLNVISNEQKLSSVHKVDIKTEVKTTIDLNGETSFNKNSEKVQDKIEKPKLNSIKSDKVNNKLKVKTNNKKNEVENSNDTNDLNKKIIEKAKVDTSSSITAYDYLMKMKLKEKIEKQKPATSNVLDQLGPRETLDSKGFLILKHQVPNLVKVPREILVQNLKENILYNDFDIVAVNKPYGMLCEARDTNKYLPDIYDLKDDLAKALSPREDSPKLYPLHRLDRGTTGVLLFAKTKERHSQIKAMFRENQVKKVYWLITKGIPTQSEGIIDIPIVEGTIGDKRRMVLHPKGDEIRQFVRSSPDASRAVTSYQVITSANSSALIEAFPETGVKHQLRVHFGFGLFCPILGDHKYSYINRLVPQRLPGDMLLKLGIRQAKVRHIPIHLHAKGIVLPEIVNGRNIFIKAPLPYHFRKNMKALQLTPKSG